MLPIFMAMVAHEDYKSAMHIFNRLQKLEPQAFQQTRIIMSDIVRSYKNGLDLSAPENDIQLRICSWHFVNGKHFCLHYLLSMH